MLRILPEFKQVIQHVDDVQVERAARIEFGLLQILEEEQGLLFKLEEALWCELIIIQLRENALTPLHQLRALQRLHVRQLNRLRLEDVLLNIGHRH